MGARERGAAKWWKTWWAKTVAALAVVVTVVGFVSSVFGIWGHFWPTPKELTQPLGVAESLDPGSSSPEGSDSVTCTKGWGPARDVFSGEHPANYAALNSITDQPRWGDQRNFVRVRNLTTAGSGDTNTFGDAVLASPGDEIDVVVNIANAAADNLDGAPATIHGLEMWLCLPAPGTDLTLRVDLQGKNAVGVWDGATVLTQSDAMLALVPGSLSFTSNAGTYALPDSFADGAHVDVGWSAADGEFPVGYSPAGQYRGHGYAQFTLRVLEPESS